MRISHRIFILGFLLFGTGANAAIKLPAIVSSHMVLQRNTKVVLWGWADANEKISVKTSWISGTRKIQADSLGNWRLEVLTTNSREPQTISVKSKESDILLEDILFGEVWLCSGQSNMYQPIKGYGDNNPTSDAMMARARAGNPELRLFTVGRVGAKAPLKDLKEFTSWQPSSPTGVSNFSAVAWFFGQQLQEIMDVPVGLIHTSWGASTVEAWISEEVLSNYQEVNLDHIVLKGDERRLPTILYNAMIHPLIPYKIRGVLWYQGESNRNDPENYKKLFPAMVQDWRTRWGIGDFPVYFAQIAPFDYRKKDPFTSINSNSAFMRVAQEQCVDLIPNSGIAIATDIGDEHRIHPPYKREVANRLLYLALDQTYGLEGIDGRSPLYENMEIINEGIRLSFKHAETGLFAFDKLTGFEIAGNDKVFYPAKAIIEDGTQVYVKSNRVADPVAVRYAWNDWAEGTLYDRNLLPASSFRTDNWENASRYTDGVSESAFDALNEQAEWKLEFEDKCTEDWKQNWVLDGLKASLENSDKGLHFSAGPEFKNDAHHAVLWTKESFEGDLKIEYDYTRTDSETKCVNILYIQATGKGEEPFAEDIFSWKSLREVPAMRSYYDNMNTLHVSYAAFVNSSDTSYYVRARRYPRPENASFNETKIAPSYDNEGYFKTGESYHITVVKTNTRLFFKMENKGESSLFAWDLSAIDPVSSGRIGLRHMYTRSAIYRTFKIYTK